MAAAYDTYDYPGYWIGREYEHEAEIFAIKSFLKKIPVIKNVVEIGAGFGRLVPAYFFRARRVVLTDPSSKLLKIARITLRDKRISFLQSSVENLHPKLKVNTADLVLVVRVLHHIEDVDRAFAVIDKVTKKGGYLIVEFANKRHLKAVFAEFLHGNFTFPLDIFPKEVKGKIKKRKSVLPFYNYHPDIIKEKLRKLGFSIVEVRSVSNIRSTFLKSIFSTETLLLLERNLQIPLAYLSFGPSIFILAKKTSL